VGRTERDDVAEQKLTAEERQGTGKGVARKLRADGRVPGILYGRNTDPVPISVDSRDLFHVLHTEAGSNVLVDLEVGGSEHLVMPWEVQQDHIHNRFVHVDFLALSRDQTIAVDVPVQQVGEAPGVQQGGVVDHHLFELHVECLPQDVPDAIEADVSSLELNDNLHVSDLVPPTGVTILTDPEELVLAVVIPAVLKTEAELGEGEVPEGEVPEGAEVAEGAEGEAVAEPGAEGAPPAAEEGAEGSQQA
jgi:large subunit ribosomal protein L25